MINNFTNDTQFMEQKTKCLLLLMMLEFAHHSCNP